MSDHPTFDVLSQREADVMRLIAAGHSNQEIARLLNFSINSIKTYIRTAYAKMGVVSRAQAVRWVLERDVVEPLQQRLAEVEAQRNVLLDELGEGRKNDEHTSDGQ